MTDARRNRYERGHQRPLIITRLRGRLLTFVGAVVLALVVAFGVGFAGHRDLAPRATELVAGGGQIVDVAGVDYRLIGFTVAEQFPAEESGSPPVHGPHGSVIVLATVSQTVRVLPADPDDLGCDFLLRGPDDVWQPDGDTTYDMARPKETTCAEYQEQPGIDRSRSIGVAFVIPATNTHGLTLRMTTGGGRRVIDFRP